MRITEDDLEAARARGYLMGLDAARRLQAVGLDPYGSALPLTMPSSAAEAPESSPICEPVPDSLGQLRKQVADLQERVRSAFRNTETELDVCQKRWVAAQQRLATLEAGQQSPQPSSSGETLYRVLVHGWSMMLCGSCLARAREFLEPQWVVTTGFSKSTPSTAGESAATAPDS